MAVTVTVGGATCGYCAIGICGIASTPARMITSEQTVARMGLRMKVSTNMRYQVSGIRFQEVPGVRFQESGFGFDRNAVLEFLDVRHDQLLAFFDAAADDVAVANQVADGDRLLPCDDAPLSLLGDEHEILTADAVDRHDGDGDRRLVGPHDTRGPGLLAQHAVLP